MCICVGPANCTQLTDLLFPSCGLAMQNNYDHDYYNNSSINHINSPLCSELLKYSRLLSSYRLFSRSCYILLYKLVENPSISHSNSESLVSISKLGGMYLVGCPLIEKHNSQMNIIAMVIIATVINILKSLSQSQRF